MQVLLVVDAADQLDGVNDGPGVERDLGEGDNGDEGTHEGCEGFGIARCSEDVGGDGLADVIAKHEDASNSGRSIEQVLNRGRDVSI